MALPYLYLKGISSGDFTEVMPVLLGKDVGGFSSDAVLRLRKQWKKRRLESKNYVYMWADGIYFRARMEDDKLSKSLHAKAKGDLHNIWMAENREEANKAFALFLDK